MTIIKNFLHPRVKPALLITAEKNSNGLFAGGWQLELWRVMKILEQAQSERRIVIVQNIEGAMAELERLCEYIEKTM